MHANTLTTQIKESLPFSILWQARAQNFLESFRVAAKEFCSIHSKYHHDCLKMVFHQSVWWSLTNFPQILHGTGQFLFVLTNSFAIAFSFLLISLSFDIFVLMTFSNVLWEQLWENLINQTKSAGVWPSVMCLSHICLVRVKSSSIQNRVRDVKNFSYSSYYLFKSSHKNVSSHFESLVSKLK